MSAKLKNKVAIVTASTAGIGFAIAKRLAQDGASVVVSSRKQANVDKAVNEIKSAGGKVFGIVCHVGKKEDRSQLIEQTLATFGGIDILISNAAVNPIFDDILKTTESVWDKIFDINVKSAFFLSKEVIPHMEQRGGGSLVFVASIGGYTPRVKNSVYGASKTALLGLTKAMVPQCSGLNIRVNCIAPGLIKTHFSSALWKTPGSEEVVKAMIPIGRMGEADECAGAVSFLVSEDASYITGETIVMAGGQTSRL